MNKNNYPNQMSMKLDRNGNVYSLELSVKGGGKVRDLYEKIYDLCKTLEATGEASLEIKAMGGAIFLRDDTTDASD